MASRRHSRGPVVRQNFTAAGVCEREEEAPEPTILSMAHLFHRGLTSGSLHHPPVMSSSGNPSVTNPFGQSPQEPANHLSDLLHQLRIPTSVHEPSRDTLNPNCHALGEGSCTSQVGWLHWDPFLPVYQYVHTERP